MVAYRNSGDKIEAEKWYRWELEWRTGEEAGTCASCSSRHGCARHNLPSVFQVETFWNTCWQIMPYVRRRHKVTDVTDLSASYLCGVLYLYQAFIESFFRQDLHDLQDKSFLIGSKYPVDPVNPVKGLGF